MQSNNDSKIENSLISIEYENDRHIIGKRILKNITINIYFNKLIYKMILCKKLNLKI